MVAAFGLGSVEHRTESGEVVLVAAGVGAAMFHLTTHAFFKALLFLGSGSVIHACHDEQDIFRMGGLGRRMKLTFATFTIAVAAIIGLPFFAGFFSKEAILALAFTQNRSIFAVLAFTAALTAFYMLRLWKLTFLGVARSPQAEHAHEGGFAIEAPLAVLAVLAVFGGMTSLYPRAIAGVLGWVVEPEGAARAAVLVTSLAVLVVGAALALIVYRSPAIRQAAAGPLCDPLQSRFPTLFGTLVALRDSFDTVYGYYIEKIQQRFAMLLNFFDLLGIGGLARALAGVVGLAGIEARAVQVGRLNVYIYWFLAGVAVLWAFAAGVF
jgi:NADH-quinone oxidoreductase subunit L